MFALFLRVFVHVSALVSVALALPLAVAVRDGDAAAARAFAWTLSAGLAAAAGCFLPKWLRGREHGEHGSAPGPGDAIAAVGAAWVAVSLFGAMPLWLSGAFASATDAVFESASGFTTTGATVLADVEAVPRAVNVWRCETHWLGGMGVIALVVALVPLLGVGGFRLLNAESTGPEKGRLTARIADTAKVLWLLYVALTAIQAVLLRLCGMDWLDAVCHA
ncbi:MAG: TrkH family potassium uptake protein, partial [Kiritimatiellae bacterium]|nr:TrkH family potassium uptake protein [Kiritimatiellia bacterium]